MDRVSGSWRARSTHLKQPPPKPTWLPLWLWSIVHYVFYSILMILLLIFMICTMGLEAVLANGFSIVKIITAPFYFMQNTFLRVFSFVSAVFVSILNLIWGLTFGAMFTSFVVIVILYHRLMEWMVHSGVTLKVEKASQQIPSVSSVIHWAIALVPDITSIRLCTISHIQNLFATIQAALVNVCKLPVQSFYSVWRTVLSLLPFVSTSKTTHNKYVATSLSALASGSLEKITQPETVNQDYTSLEFLQSKQLKDACNSKKQLFYPE